MPWLIITTKQNTHMVPKNDAINHTTVTGCWCHPKLDEESNLNFPNYLHNNFTPDEEGNGEEPEDGKYN